MATRGRLHFDGDNVYTEKKLRIHKLTEDVEGKIDNIPGVVNDLGSDSETDALSAKMGKVLYDQINSISGTGKFLSAWDCTTGLPLTNPQEDPYTYKVGDYYVVSVVGSTNYKPHGGTFTQGVPSTAVETENVGVNDKYYFDGADWTRIPDTSIQTGIDSSLSTTSTNAVENRAIANAINTKQNIISDLNTIRSGAAAGATALQKLDNISELTNNIGYQTAGDVNSAIQSAIGQLPTVNDGVLTIQKNSTTIDTFSANSANNKTINIPVPTTVAELSDANNYVTKTDVAGDLADYTKTSDLGAVALSNDYNDLNNKPTIPTVNNATLTIQKNSANVATFTANASSNVTANISVPTTVAELSDSSSYATKAYVDEHAGSTYTAGDNVQISAQNVISATDTTYNAGEGIAILNGSDYSAMQGPAPDGFHIPLLTEWQGLKTIMDGLSLTTGDGWRINLHMPFAGNRRIDDASLYSQGTSGVYWSAYSSSINGYYLFINSSSVNAIYGNRCALGYSLRCFKDSYMTPDSAWTVVQGTLGSAGIFWNQTEGLISITDGTTGYTIMDKNLGATTVYNNGDTLTQANMGNMYQWGNNYGFPSTGTISNTSPTQVNASAYGPNTENGYYSSDTFIIRNDNWSSVVNEDLWGGVTGVVTFDNAISVDADAIKNISVSGASTGTFLRAAQAAGTKHTIDMGIDRTYTFQGVGYILIDNWMGWELVINGIVIFSETHSGGTYEYKHPSSIYTMGPGDIVRMRRPGSRGSRGGEVADFY